MKRLLIAWLWAASFWAATAHAQNVSLSEDAQIADLAANALWWSDFDELERQHALYQQPGQFTASGRSKLMPFRDGLYRIFKGPAGASDAFYVQMEAVTLQWVQAHPKSSLAPVLHATALAQHGWSYRGHGYARTVPPDAWRDFHRYIAKAVDFLSAHQSVVMQSSSGPQALLDLGRAAGWQQAAIRSVAQAGVALNADDDGLYLSMLRGVLPKWGGSAVQVDRLIGDIAKATASTRADHYYVSLYTLAADEEFEHRLFDDTGVSWPRMKAGFQQMIDRYPDARNINAFARFACLARDKATLLDLLDRVGSKPVLASWGSNARRTFETCKRWASEQ